MNGTALDLEFLEGDEARGLRLQLEYLQPEFVLEKRGIRHTIAVFGSTRIGPEHPSYAMAREFGVRVAREGGAVVTGGGPGVMEAANRGAREAGGASIGMNITLPLAQKPNAYVTPGLAFNFRYFALRKLHFLLRARALVAFPGGYGTLDEIFETLMLVQTGKLKSLPIVLVGEAYWRRAFDAQFLASQGMIGAADAALFCYAEQAAGAWEKIASWYRLRGEPVFPKP